MISQRQAFLQYVAQTSEEPLALEIMRASGITLTGHDRRRYMDLISGISVSNLGHRHPEVIRAIQKQLKKYMHLMVYGELVQAPQTQLAKALSAILPRNLSCTYFVNSGSEAVEGAMKLSKRYTGRREIISCKNAYHGSTQGALSLMGSEFFKEEFRPLLPDTRRISFNNFDDIKLITGKTAAVFIEPIQGEAGAVPGNPEWLKAVREQCNSTGALLVFDEIQTGYGRTGKMFAFEHSQVIPDILLLAKGFGGGMPLGAFISSPEIMNSLAKDPVLGHITTFGGHPVSCAAGLATLKVLQSAKLVEMVEEKEKLFRSLLVHPSIKAINGMGLLLAIEFESEEFNKKLIGICIKNGVLTDWFLFNAHSMRLAPPLVITTDQVKRAAKLILKSVEEAVKSN